MKFIYKQDSSNRYYITIVNNENIHHVIPMILKIPKYKYIEFLRENGGKLDINGKVYFLNKEDIKKVIDQLNVMYNLLK